MGFLRGAGVTILSLILFVILLIGGMFAIFNLSLKYENVQPRVYNVLNSFIENSIGEEQIKNEFLNNAEIYCQTNEEFISDFEGYVIVLPCPVIREGYDSVLNYSINFIIDDLYYKEYNCTFFNCFEESTLPLFLISDFSQGFFKILFFKFLILFVILFGLIFLLVKNKPNSLLVSGSLMVAVSLFILAFKKAGEFFMSSLLTGEGGEDILSSIIGIFFSQSSKVFLEMLISGGILIVLGIILGIIFSKFKEEKSEDNLKEKKSLEKTPIEKKISKPKVSRKKKK